MLKAKKAHKIAQTMCDVDTQEREENKQKVGAASKKRRKTMDFLLWSYVV